MNNINTNDVPYVRIVFRAWNHQLVQLIQLVSLSLWVCFPRPMSFASGPSRECGSGLPTGSGLDIAKRRRMFYMIHIIRFSNTHQHILDIHA